MDYRDSAPFCSGARDSNAGFPAAGNGAAGQYGFTLSHHFPRHWERGDHWFFHSLDSVFKRYSSSSSGTDDSFYHGGECRAGDHLWRFFDQAHLPLENRRYYCWCSGKVPSAFSGCHVSGEGSGSCGTSNADSTTRHRPFRWNAGAGFGASLTSDFGAKVKGKEEG